METEQSTAAHPGTSQRDDHLRCWIQEQAQKRIRPRAGAPALGTGGANRLSSRSESILGQTSTGPGKIVITQGEATGSVGRTSLGGTVLLGRWQRGLDEWVLEEVSRAVEGASRAGRGQRGRREGRLAARESAKAARSRTAGPEGERGTQASSVLLGDIRGTPHLPRASLSG